MQAERKEIKAIQGRLIDGTGSTSTKKAIVVIEGEKIKKVGEASEMEIPDDAELIDASDKTVMPGLIDSHLHFMGLVSDKFVEERIVRPKELGIIKAVFDARDLLEAGFTTVKDCGSRGGIFLKKAMKEGWSKGIIKAPRVLAAGRALSQTFGHGDAHYFPIEYARQLNPCICDGVPECIKAARLALREGADFIKVMTSGGVMSQRDRPEHTQFTLEEIRAIVREAEKVGTFVTAHCQGTEAIKLSIEGGIRTIDHAFYPDEEAIKTAIERNVAFVPTLSINQQIVKGGVEAGYPPWAVEKAEEAWEEVCKNIEKSHKAGVPICAATDFCGSPLLKFGKNAMELELLVEKCHFKPMEAIIAATKNAAEYACNLGDKIGTIEEGKLADIIIVDGDPLEDITILQDLEKIKIVMKNGEIEVNRGI